MLTRDHVVGYKFDRQFRNGLYIVFSSLENAPAWPCRRAYGGHGSYVGSIRGRLYSSRRRCFRDATERYRCERRSRGPGIPNQDDGHATADWKVGKTPRECCANPETDLLAGLRRLLDGTILTPASAAGYHLWTSILNNLSSS